MSIAHRPFGINVLERTADVISAKWWYFKVYVWHTGSALKFGIHEIRLRCPLSLTNGIAQECLHRVGRRHRHFLLSSVDEPYKIQQRTGMAALHLRAGPGRYSHGLAKHHYHFRSGWIYSRRSAHRH